MIPKHFDGLVKAIDTTLAEHHTETWLPLELAFRVLEYLEQLPPTWRIQ